MRKILVPFALMGLTSVAMIGCDVEDTEGDVTNTTDVTTPNDTSDVPPPPTEYYALVVDDSVQFPDHRPDGGNPCATSSVDAHGADIDAVELLNGSTSLGFWATTKYQPGTMCEIAAKYSDSNEAEGPSDGTLTENFVSLGGGRIGGEFEASSLQILESYTVIVYEVGVAEGGIDEEYTVSITEELSCLDAGQTCESVEIGDGAGESTFALSGF